MGRTDQTVVLQHHGFVGMQRDGLVRRPVPDFDAPADQGRLETPLGLARRNVEFRAQHADIAGVGLDDERLRLIVRDVEHRLARNPHRPLPACENRRIFQRRAGIEPYGGAVRKRQAHRPVLRRKGLHGPAYRRADVLRREIGDAGRKDHRSSGRRAPAPQPDREIPAPVLFVAGVDRRGGESQGLQLKPDSVQFRTVFGRDFQPCRNPLLLLRRSQTFEVLV